VHDEHVSDTEGLVAPEDALSQYESARASLLKNLRSLNAFDFDLDLLPPNSDHGDNRPLEEQSLPENKEATTARPKDGFTHGTTSPPTSRSLHQMSVDGGSDQDSGKASSVLGKDNDHALYRTYWLRRPRITVKDYSLRPGLDALEVDEPNDYRLKTIRYQDTDEEVNLETSDKATRKKERRSKRQYDKRKKETARKREIGAASLKKGEELVEHMFDSGWVPSDMHEFKVTLAVLMEDRVKIYQELVKEGWSDHGWWLHQLMSSWERESSTTTAKEKKKEKERFQLLVKGTWLEDVES
jgi:hypothetical protein